MTFITTELRLETTLSTMVAAREACSGQDFLLVTSREQTAGKGTHGRSWQSPRGNVYMTVGIHRRHLPPGRLALLPLEIGLLLWDEASARLNPESRPALTLKWPNDLLLGGAKAAGVLMESHGEMLLCGVGVNVAEAPVVGDGGSPSARLADGGMPAGDCQAFAEGFYRRVIAAFSSPAQDEAGSGGRGTESKEPARPDHSEQVLLAWQARCDWNRRHRLRDKPGMPWVKPVSLNRQGHLLVRHEDGSTEWLVSDYLA